MANTYIDTNKLPHTKTPEGEYVEVLNNALCGAKNVVGTLRWVKAGRTLRRRERRAHQSARLPDGRRGHHHAEREVHRGGEGQRDLSGAVGIGAHRAAGHRPAQTLPVGRTETGRRDMAKNVTSRRRVLKGGLAAAGLAAVRSSRMGHAGAGTGRNARAVHGHPGELRDEPDRGRPRPRHPDDRTAPSRRRISSSRRSTTAIPRSTPRRSA